MLHPLSQKIKSIKESLKKSLDEGAAPLAAFDADGTLWKCDVGELFFEYQIHNKLVDVPSDPWTYYYNLLKSYSDGRGFLWLAQINQGVPITQVRDWAKSCIDSQKNFPIFKEQKEIISFLHSEKVKVYVVSASIKWAVEPAAALMGIAQDNVLAIQTKIVNGKVTTEQAEALTWKEGKVLGLNQATQNAVPFFCSGNSEGDLRLLEHSSKHRLVIASADENHPNYKTERKILGIANDHDWWSIDYVNS
jgi:phosphoserine phosphatase